MFSFSMNEAWFHVSVVALKTELCLMSDSRTSPRQNHENMVFELESNTAPKHHDHCNTFALNVCNSVDFCAVYLI